MAYFSVNIVPLRSNIIKNWEKKQGLIKDAYHSPSEAFKPIGQLDVERLDAGYNPGNDLNELLAGVFVVFYLMRY